MSARPPPWAPTFVESLKLAKRPIATFLLFTALGLSCLSWAILHYEHDPDNLERILLFFGGGFLMVPVGQLIALRRVKILYFTLSWAVVFGLTLVAAIQQSGDGMFLPTVMCCEFGLGCGFLSLQHRFELFASFWPSVGWIGCAIYILNETDRVSDWEADKVKVWTPVTLFCLAGFLVFFLGYLAAKHSQRLMFWQALGGGAARRIARPVAAALPKRNLGPLAVVAALVFAFAALLAPYLWRTGKGEHPSDRPTTGEPRDQEDRDGMTALERALEAFAQQAERVLPALWPLLLLAAAYRPMKRAFVLRQLREPLFPTPPSERIENLWEYLRIAMIDAGVTPQASDSIEQLLAKLHARGHTAKGLDQAATIYARTRYGFAVPPGDAAWLRHYVVNAAHEIRSGLSTFEKVRIWFRPLD